MHFLQKITVRVATDKNVCIIFKPAQRKHRLLGICCVVVVVVVVVSLFPKEIVRLTQSPTLTIFIIKRMLCKYF